MARKPNPNLTVKAAVSVYNNKLKLQEQKFEIIVVREESSNLFDKISEAIRETGIPTKEEAPNE